MKRIFALFAVLILGALPLIVGGQGRGAPATPVVTMDKLRENFYVLKGSGTGNTGVFITNGGVVLVDTKNAGWGPAMMEKIKTVTNKPVIMVINTHAHADHTGSNNFFDSAAVEFVAHENTRANMQRMAAFQGDGAKFLPRTTYKDKLTLLKGKDEVDLYYFGTGHTNGDTFVVFPALGILQCGDMFSRKETPIIDTMNGGSALNYGESLGKVAASLKGIDTVITGHSDTTMTMADLKEFSDLNKDFISWVKDEIQAGKSAEAAAAEFKIFEKYKGYGIGTMLGGIRGNIQTAYSELKK